MPPRQGLGELELVMLLTMLRIDDAYGAAIRIELEARTGRAISPGAVYATLDRLESKGLVRSWAGDPVAEPGGRSRRLFAVTPRGLSEVKRTWRQFEALGEGVEALKPKVTPS